ncbi:MAG: rhamnosyltransferase [Rhodospirillaceae bacterium]|nr:rhamnosyltransferase [Rhodospirillaceae bacterium]
MTTDVTLDDLARSVLHESDPISKARASQDAAAVWRCGIVSVEHGPVEDRPARPDHPELEAPQAMPRRRALTTPAGRVALLHALAHIEFNAIDLAWDITARFPGQPDAFYTDWIAVGDDEARHFLLLHDRLTALGSHYGALPAHDGLWQAAQDTSDDLLARLAIVPLVLEARGLDVTPAMIERLRQVGDEDSVAVLEVIYRDEVDHVASGSRWFNHVCHTRGLEPEDTWRQLVRDRFKGKLKPPFNDQARSKAGLMPSFYAEWDTGTIR